MKGARPLALAALAALACGSPRKWPAPVTPGEWADLRRALDAERAAQPRAPWSADVRVTLHVPARTISGRGAIAADPGRALRMILVGGPGATLMDLWVTRDHWRLAIPPVRRVLRGALDDPPDLPVGFLRWWFCSPLEGTLVAGGPRGGGGTLFVLRDGEAIVELYDEPGGLSASRQLGGSTQTVRQSQRAWRPAPGDVVHYEDRRGSITVDLTVDSLSQSPPAHDAFVDPDAPPEAP